MMAFYLELPHEQYTTPNDRDRWKRQRCTRSWRHNAHLVAVEARLPKLTEAQVTLAVTPGDKRGRDVDNWSLVLKAAIDGLVDAGVCDDDRYPHLTTVAIHQRAPADQWRWQMQIKGKAVTGD